MRDFALTDMERLGAFDEAERTFQMTEEAFRVFYELTARPVRAYLGRMTSDDRLADDLLQEAYYKFLRSNAVFESDDHRRHYLFRIATNLVRDHRRRPRVEVPVSAATQEAIAAPVDAHNAERAAARIDLSRAMDHLKPRERSLLWLAYAQGWSHEEIATALGVKTASLKGMLFRARHRLAVIFEESRRPVMSSMECTFEDRVVRAVLSGQWPGEDEALMAHAQHCHICSEVVEVAVVLRADHDQARREVQVPVAGQVWWRSAVRARLESAQAATRPMAWLHGVTAAITLGIMLAIVGMAWPTLIVAADWARETVVPLLSNGEVSVAVGGVLRQSMMIAAAAAACLIVAPVLLYFVLSND